MNSKKVVGIPIKSSEQARKMQVKSVLKRKENAVKKKAVKDAVMEVLLEKVELNDGRKVTKLKYLAINAVKNSARNTNFDDIIKLQNILGETSQKIDLTSNGKDIITRSLSIKEINEKLDEINEKV